jgi:hypothetical protein
VHFVLTNKDHRAQTEHSLHLRFFKKDEQTPPNPEDD